jgi:hypothetical protein
LYITNKLSVPNLDWECHGERFYPYFGGVTNSRFEEKIRHGVKIKPKKRKRKKIWILPSI